MTALFPIRYSISTPVVFSNRLRNGDPKSWALENALEHGIITGKDMIDLNSYATAIFSGVRMSESLASKARMLNERIFIFDMTGECYLPNERERLFNNALKSAFGKSNNRTGDYSFANIHFAGENDPNPNLHSFEFFAKGMQEFGFEQDGWYKMDFEIVPSSDEHGNLVHDLMIYRA